MKSSYISIYQYTGKSFVSHSVFDSNWRIFCYRIFKFKCHMKLASICISLNFLNNWEFGENFFKFRANYLFIYWVSIIRSSAHPLSHSKVCRDSVPSAIFPLFSHQDPARTCYSLSMGQRQRRREEEGKRSQYKHDFLYTGNAIKAVQEHFSESFYPD